MMKVAVFSAKRYDRDFLDVANASAGHQLVYFDAPLEWGTVALAVGYDARCVSSSMTRPMPTPTYSKHWRVRGCASSPCDAQPIFNIIWPIFAIFLLGFFFNKLIIMSNHFSIREESFCCAIIFLSV